MLLCIYAATGAQGQGGASRRSGASRRRRASRLRGGAALAQKARMAKRNLLVLKFQNGKANQRKSELFGLIVGS
jgi:hypothetical protein